MWGELIEDIKIIIHNLTEGIVNEIDEQLEINKKREFEEKGITLYKHNNSSKRKIVTLNGSLEIKRIKLYDEEKKVTVITKDEYLEIHELPYKMTVQAIEQVSFIGQNKISFRASSELLEKLLGIEISASNVRKVTEYVGKAIYKTDTMEADKKYDDIVNLNIKRQREDVNYM